MHARNPETIQLYTYMTPMWVVLKNYGPLLVLEYVSGPNIWVYKNGTLILGTTHVAPLKEFRREDEVYLNSKNM